MYMYQVITMGTRFSTMLSSAKRLQLPLRPACSSAGSLVSSHSWVDAVGSSGATFVLARVKKLVADPSPAEGWSIAISLTATIPWYTSQVMRWTIWHYLPRTPLPSNSSENTDWHTCWRWGVLKTNGRGGIVLPVKLVQLHIHWRNWQQSLNEEMKLKLMEMKLIEYNVVWYPVGVTLTIFGPSSECESWICVVLYISAQLLGIYRPWNYVGLLNLTTSISISI